MQTEQLHGQTLQTDAQTAVRRSTVFVQQQEGLKQGRIHAAVLELLELRLVVVDALTAGGDFQTAEQQVKAERNRRIFRVIHGVKRTLC